MCVHYGQMTGWMAARRMVDARPSRLIGACITIVSEFQQLCVQYFFAFFCTIPSIAARLLFYIICMRILRTLTAGKASWRWSNFQTDMWRYSFRFRHVHFPFKIFFVVWRMAAKKNRVYNKLTPHRWRQWHRRRHFSHDGIRQLNEDKQKKVSTHKIDILKVSDWNADDYHQSVSHSVAHVRRYLYVFIFQWRDKRAK